MQLNLEDLNIFIQIVESGSLSAAAERLNVPVSTVSRSLSGLEARLGLTLLHRSTRRMTLTDEGRLLLSQSGSILDSVRSLESKLASRRSEAGGILRINTSMPVMLHVLAPAIPDFKHTYPHIDIELNSDDTYIDLIEERTDVAIRIGRLQDSMMNARLLGHTPIRILASRRYLDTHGTPNQVADLAQHNLLGFTRPATLNQWPIMSDHGRLYEITPTLTASSGETLRALALQGMGIVCLSDMMTHQDQATSQLIPILENLREPISQPIYAVYYRHRALAPRTSVFIDYLADYIAQTSWFSPS